MVWQVTTLLSKAEQAEAQQKVTPDALAALEAKASEQGKAVAEVKAVRSSFARSAGRLHTQTQSTLGSCT